MIFVFVLVYLNKKKNTKTKQKYELVQGKINIFLGDISSVKMGLQTNKIQSSSKSKYERCCKWNDL